MNFQNPFEEKSKLYSTSLAATISFFFITFIIESVLSLHYGFYTNAGIVFCICLLYIGLFLFGQSARQRSFSPQLVFFLTSAAVCFLIFRNGNSQGSFFYLFPIAIGYINSSSSLKNRIRFREFYIIITFITAFVIVRNLLFVSTIKTLHGDIFLKYRFVASFILTALLIAHSILLKSSNKGNAPGKADFSDALFNSYMDAYIIFKKETLEVIEYNKTLDQILELPEATNMRGLYITQVMMRYLADDSTNMDLLMNKIPEDWYGEARFVSHKKTKFDTYLKSSVFVKDETEYQLLSIRNITEITKAKEDLEIYKEKMEKAASAKARFLSSMSHELRTPLNGIIGTSNLILGENNLPENIKNHINVLRYSSDHMLGVINDILDFSKMDAGKAVFKRQKFNMKESLDKLTKSFATEYKNKNIELVFKHDQRLEGINVLSDHIKLNQVLANLLSNALKFTILGKVELNVKIENISEKTVTVFFEVHDTGIGISKEKHEEIFNDFVQVHDDNDLRRFDGTGLGLTISEKIVNIFGGRLEVESELEKGSRFYFTLAFNLAAETVVVKEEIIKSGIAPDIRGVRILVVEDNEINAGIVRTFLQRWQIRIKEGRNGIHALELLKYHKFDLILMDLEMPEMDGYTALKKIRETDKVTPIVAFTAALLEDMDSLITECGFNNYILKPFSPDDLKKKIEMYAPHRKIEYV